MRCAAIATSQIAFQHRKLKNYAGLEHLEIRITALCQILDA